MMATETKLEPCCVVVWQREDPMNHIENEKRASRVVLKVVLRDESHPGQSPNPQPFQRVVAEVGAPDATGARSWHDAGPMRDAILAAALADLARTVCRIGNDWRGCPEHYPEPGTYTCTQDELAETFANVGYVERPNDGDDRGD